MASGDASSSAAPGERGAASPTVATEAAPQTVRPPRAEEVPVPETPQGTTRREKNNRRRRERREEERAERCAVPYSCQGTSSEAGASAFAKAEKCSSAPRNARKRKRACRFPDTAFWKRVWLTPSERPWHGPHGLPMEHGQSDDGSIRYVRQGFGGAVAHVTSNDIFYVNGMVLV